MRLNLKEINLGGIFAILGLAAMAIGLIITIVLPGIVISTWLSIGVGAVMLVLAFIFNFRQYNRAITSRRSRLRLGTLIMTSIFAGIIILLNAISSIFYHRFDMSSLSEFTLTGQTVRVLKDLKKPVKVTGFFVPNDPYSIGNYLTSLLNEYGENSRELTIQFVDPDQHPDQAKKYGITEYQTVVFENGKRRRLVPPSRYVMLDESGMPAGVKAEHSFTSAILEVTGVAQKSVYFLAGHGEAGIDASYNKVKEGLLNDLYNIYTINLKTNPKIPGNCAALIIAGPENILSGGEIEIISDYLKNGGQAFVLFDRSRADIINLLKPWGIDTGDGTIIDPSSSVAPHEDMPIVPANRNYFNLPEVYFPGATAVIPGKKLPDGVEMMPLVYTDKGSWLDKNFITGKIPVFNPETEKRESLAIGALITKTPGTGSTDRTTRLIVIGDSDFASNTHFENANNGDLFLNSVGWLAEETPLISIRRNVQPFRRLVVTPGQVNFIEYTSIALIPFLLLLTAGVIWWRRR